MRVIVFFDLPTGRASQRRAYNAFRKYLIKSGFLMLQESAYSKLALNTTAADIIVKNLRTHKPPQGIVQVLTITEKQFAKIECIVGEIHSEVVDSTDRVVIL